MKGHNKYIAVAVAVVGIATLGIAGSATAGQATAPQTDSPQPRAADAVPDEASGGRFHSILRIADSTPHLLQGEVADVIVRIRGGICSGTPITGTRYVVTAAHCVLAANGEVTTRVVVRDDVTYPAVAVLVDPAYHDNPRPELDAAVLVLADPIPGPSAKLGSALPAAGQVTLAGLQPIDVDGTLLRGDDPHDRPLPKDATGTVVKLEHRTAGCVEPVDSLEVGLARVTVHCGLIPGSSGGGLFAEQDGELTLVGIISTVTADLSANGVVPLSSLHELLRHPELYSHPLPSERSQNEHLRLVLT